MIDVSAKFNTLRYAKAEGILKVSKETIELIVNRQIQKGDVVEVARAAGISSAKRTSDWMVFCHPIPLDWVDVKVNVEEEQLRIESEIRTVWKTGVEMEALTAVNAALLNAYDMLKPVDDNMTIENIRLVKKKGGKSDYLDNFKENIKTAVLVISDSTYKGTRKDKSGKVIQEFLENHPVSVEVYEILPDNEEQISNRIAELIDKQEIQLVLTTGGTGLGPKDLTPEATKKVIDKEAPGIVEAIRKHGKERTPFAMLSRETAGIRNESLIINLPGSSRGAKESMEAIFPGVLHSFPMIWGGGH